MKFTKEFIGEFLQMLDTTPKDVAINALIEVRRLIKENEELKAKNETSEQVKQAEQWKQACFLNADALAVTEAQFKKLNQICWEKHEEVLKLKLQIEQVESTESIHRNTRTR